MFSLTSPSLLALDKERAEGHVHTIDGIERVPCDTHMRAILDPVAPEWLRPWFKSVFGPWPRGKALEPRAFLDGPSWRALDGTGYFSSKTMHWASGRQQIHRNGSIPSVHQMWGAAMMHPAMRDVMPLMPEPMVKHDGTDQNEGARHAAKRLVAKLRQDHPPLTVIVTEDRLRSHAPPIQTLQDHHLPSLLGVTEGDHALLCTQVQEAEHAGRVT
jgi:hypothetical protein